MTALDENRAKIDRIDTEIERLFEERFHAVEGIVKYKMENDLPVLDSSREESIIENSIARLHNKELEKYYRDFYQHLLDVSKEYQKEIMEKEGK